MKRFLFPILLLVAQLLLPPPGNPMKSRLMIRCSILYRGKCGIA